jgi:23S rRNA pseudouridine955/2504/2580 synthase
MRHARSSSLAPVTPRRAGMPPRRNTPPQRRTREYTPETAVETTPYEEGEPLVEPPAEPPSPARVGVRHLEVSEARAGQRLDNFLLRELEGVPRSHIYRLVRRGEVRVNGHRARPEQRLQSADRVRLPPLRQAPAEAERGVPESLRQVVAGAILQEDERVLVLNKPAGVAVHGGSGVSFGVIEALRALRPGEHLELVHRLDRDTSGCLLIARSAAVLRTLHALLREGHFEKGYLALLAGRWNLGRKRLDLPLRTDLRVSGERTVRVHPSGKPALSVFRPVQFFGPLATLVEVALHTGRTHQIRVHAAHAGHPVMGDEKYGDAAANAKLRELGLARMFLHAHTVSFDWPQGGSFSVSAPLPQELHGVLERLSTARARPASAASRRPR